MVLDELTIFKFLVFSITSNDFPMVLNVIEMIFEQSWVKL